ncbi:hypothetical protein ACFFX0_13650 [Citricoccus parietis]|uniref:Uncharacterized protein n=1 Tax=Citricoccus parietis TaxID=592307 RepID=A0ABV5FZT4_9MICC
MRAGRSDQRGGWSCCHCSLSHCPRLANVSAEYCSVEPNCLHDFTVALCPCAALPPVPHGPHPISRERPESCSTSAVWSCCASCPSGAPSPRWPGP